MKRENRIFEIIIPPQDIACEPGLLQKLAGGDRDAYAWVYKNYCRKVYDYAMLKCTSHPPDDLSKKSIPVRVLKDFLQNWHQSPLANKVTNFSPIFNTVTW